MFLVGRAFSYLLGVEGRLQCKLTFQSTKKKTVQTDIYLDARIVNDFVVSCNFRDKSLLNKQYFNFEKAPLAKFSMGLSIEKKEVALSTKGANPEVLMIQSVPAVNIKYSDPSSIPITNEQTTKQLHLYVSKSSILKEADSQHARIVYSCQF